MKWIVWMALSLTACSDPFGDAQKANTVEAYEKFITENAESSRVFEANLAIEKLMTDKARETQDVADFDAYLEKYKSAPPNKTLYGKMMAERQQALWNKASDSNKVEDWKEFISQYEASAPKDVRIARQRLSVAEYLPFLTMDPIEKTQINLSGDPNGPLDGWSFSTMVTNSGDKEIESLRLRIVFLDDADNIISSSDFTVIGCGDYCQRKFVFEDPSYAKQEPEIGRIKPPLKAKEQREFLTTTGSVPPNWSKKIQTDFISIKFVKPD